jgi:hypothetical protein
MTHVYDFLGFCTVLVLFLALVLLLRGPFRKYWVVLIYAAWELSTDLALTVVHFFYNGPAQVTPPGTDALGLYARLYWTNDVVDDLLRFLLVILLIYRATPQSSRRAAVGRLLSGVVVAASVLPFILFHPIHPNTTHWPLATWFNSTSELLNFAAAIMNLVLWATLIGSGQRDPQLLMVSAGLGVVVTGTAISYGLRHFIPPGGFRAVINLFLMLTQLGGWMLWCRAFWPVTAARQAHPDALTSH